MKLKTTLTIAGSDCSGGAGIQADLKTMTVNGVYAMSVVTALTAQNTLGVRAISAVTPQFLADQLDAVLTDIFPDAVKIGMVPTAAQNRVICEKLRGYRVGNIVCDPVMMSTSGTALIEPEAAAALSSLLFPISTLITPNIPEAAYLTGREILSADDMCRAAETLHKTYGCAVLLKGGHGVHSGDGADDYLYADGCARWFYGTRIDNPNAHGTGCTLSSAIAANLAKGFSVEESVLRAKRYLTGALAAGLALGAGRGPLHHGYVCRGDYMQSPGVENEE